MYTSFGLFLFHVHHLCMLLLGPELVNKILVSCILTSETCLPIPCYNSYTIFFPTCARKNYDSIFL